MKNNTLLIFTLLMYAGWHTTIYNGPNKYKDINKNQKKEQDKKDALLAEKKSKEEKEKKEAEAKKAKYDKNLATFNKIEKNSSTTQSQFTKKKYAEADNKLKETFDKKTTQQKIDLWKKESQLEKNPFANLDTDFFSPEKTKIKSAEKQKNVDIKKEAKKKGEEKKQEEKKQQESKGGFFSNAWNTIKSGAKSLGKSEIGKGVKEIAKNATTSIANTAIQRGNEKINTTVEKINNKIAGEKSTKNEATTIENEKPEEEAEEDPFANTDTDIFTSAKSKSPINQNSSYEKNQKKDNGKEIHSEDTIKNDESMDHKSTSINAITSKTIETFSNNTSGSKSSKNKKSKKRKRRK